jgi:plasmid maintenance system killer protein
VDVAFAERFDRSLRQAPMRVQRAFWKQLEPLMSNLHHPSLRSKKYEGADDLWQARVNREWRFYFRIIGDKYYMVDITAHPK